MAIELIAKIAPYNDGFVGMVDADQVLGGGGSGTLPDACVASANVTQHQGDIKLDNLGTPDDNTDLDFSTTKHGLVPKGTDVGHFLKDDGTWAAGAGGGDTHPMVDTTNLVKGSGDATKLFKMEVDGNTTGVTGTLATGFTTAKTVTLPDATDTLVGKATTDILTNKSISGEQINSGTLPIARIADAAVTYAKIQNVSATDRFLGRDTAGAGVIEEIAAAGARTILNVADGANNYAHPNHTGDVTSVADGATTITADSVTYDKMQDATASDKLLGRQTAGAGTIEEIACTAAGRALIDDADTAAQRTTLGVVIGTDVLAQQTIGIADNNLVEMDDADAADNDYAKFTLNGLEGREKSEVLSDLNVEDGADVTDATNVAAAGAIMDGDITGNGLMIRTGAGSYTNRSIVVDDAKLTVANGDGVAGNPSLGFGSVALADLSDGANAVTAAGTLTNNRLVRGDSADKAVQYTGIIVNDSDEMTNINLLEVDDLQLDDNKISGIGANTTIRFYPSGTGSIGGYVTGTATANKDVWAALNLGWAASMVNTRSSFAFNQATSSGAATSAYSGRITVGTETNWTTTASTQDSYMAFQTALDGTVAEKMRINSAGAVGINTTSPGDRSPTNILLDIRRDANGAGYAVYTHHNTLANRGSTVYGARSRGTDAAPTIVQNGDRLFAFVSQGFDGVIWRTSANIIFDVDGAPAAGAVPTSIGFWTGAGGATSARLTIQSDGDILVDSGTAILIRDPQISLSSSVDGQMDLAADTEIEFTTALIDLNFASVRSRTSNGIDYGSGVDGDIDLITAQVTGTPRLWWDESGNAFAMTHRLILPEGIQTKYATDDVADPPTDAQLDTAFGDPTTVGSGFIGILDDNDAGTECYICWTTGTAGEWFYHKGTKAV